MIRSKQVREFKQWCVENEGEVETDPSLTEITCELSSEYEHEPDATFGVHEVGDSTPKSESPSETQSQTGNLKGQAGDSTNTTSEGPTGRRQRKNKELSPDTSINATRFTQNSFLGTIHLVHHVTPIEQHSKRTDLSFSRIGGAAFEGTNFKLWRDCVGAGLFGSADKHACRRWFDRQGTRQSQRLMRSVGRGDLR